MLQNSKHKYSRKLKKHLQCIYRRLGFDCEYAIIANCEFISSSQKLERKKMYAINSEIWSQPTSYQCRAKQGCLTTSYKRSTRRWLAAFSTKGAAALVARSESIQLCLQQTGVHTRLYTWWPRTTLSRQNRCTLGMVSEGSRQSMASSGVRPHLCALYQQARRLYTRAALFMEADGCIQLLPGRLHETEFISSVLLVRWRHRQNGSLW